MFDETMLMGVVCEEVEEDEVEASDVASTATTTTAAKLFAFVKAKAKARIRSKNHLCNEAGCGKAFGSSTTLKNHSYTHSGKRQFPCTYESCDKTFSQKANRNKHLLTHTGDKPFTCTYEDCDKAFAQKITLDRHMRTHTGDKPFPCPYDGCDLAFAQKGHLNNHLRTHTGERPYTCPYEGCDKAFAQKIDLTTHLRTHTGDKPYTCPYEGCDLTFAQKSALTTHIRKHTGERPYTCPYEGCDKAFAQKSALTTHIRRHTGEKPYTCDVDGCTKAFVVSSKLHVHIQRHHNATYVARKKVAEERVRTRLLKEGWKEHFGDTLPLVGYFKRELRIDFTCLDPNSSYGRIDFVIWTPGGLVFLEVDEHQHRFGYHAELSCDMKRMNQVMASLTLELGDARPHVYWLRYNPNAWHLDEETQRVPTAEREDRLMAYLAAVNLTEPLQVGYAYYDTYMGELEVLQNEDYHSEWAEVTHDLGALVRASNVHNDLVVASSSTNPLMQAEKRRAHSDSTLVGIKTAKTPKVE